MRRCWFFIILWNMAQTNIYVDLFGLAFHKKTISTLFLDKVMLPLWLCSFLIILYHLQFQIIVCHAMQLFFLKRMLKSISNKQIINNTIIWYVTSCRLNARTQGLCGSLKKTRQTGLRNESWNLDWNINFSLICCLNLTFSIQLHCLF